MATRGAVVEGERNVLITAPTNNALIVTGDRNTVEMKLEGAGAALAFAFRWNRPKPRRRGDRPTAPAPFDLHVDREQEVLALAAAVDPPRVVNVYGPPGIGKTHVLVEALNRRGCEMRDGCVYLDGRARDADDLLHAVFEALFETRVPLRDVQIERHLADRRALLALENVELTPERAQRLALGAPHGRLFVTSRERVLFDGVPLKIEGLATQDAVAIAEQELGRPLTGRERAAAESVAEGLRGHPLQLRQTFSRARDAGLSIEQLAPRAASAYERAQQLSAQERTVARTLAVHGEAPLGVEHIEALAGDGAAGAAAALEARHEARSHSPRYSLAGGLAEAFDEGALRGEIDHALDHFTRWAQSEARAGRRERVLLESAALVALLERARAAERNEEVVALGLAIEGALAWGNRWAAWRRVLELVLAAARAGGDSLAEAAALHQLGTRAYAAGDARAAEELLEQALALRERIGDTAGAEVTRQNLRVVSGGPPLLYRLSHLPLAIVAALVAVLVVAAGVAGAGGLREAEPDDDGGGAVKAQLVVTLAGPGSVASTDGAIRCGARCEARFDVGTTIVLEADPADRAEFTGWSRPCEGVGRCKLTLREDTQVAATFAGLRDPERLTVSVTGMGRGSVVSKPAAIDCPRECSASFARGRTVQLYAAKGEGSAFVGWSGGGCSGSVRRCDVTMNGARTVTARFARDPAGPADDVTLRIVASGDGSGTVTGPRGLSCPPDCKTGFPAATRTVTLDAQADEGSTFVGWGDTCRGNERACEVTLVAPATTVRARFDRAPEPEEGMLHVQFGNPGHGRVTSDPEGVDCTQECRIPLPRGREVTLRATDARGWSFAGWEGAGCSGTDTCRVTVGELTRVTANFEPDTFRLTTVTQGTAGTLAVKGRDCAGGCRFARGSEVEVVATSDDPVSWTGCEPQTATTCSVTMTENRTVVATFQQPSPK